MYIDIYTASLILEKSFFWIKTRMLNLGEFSYPINLHWFLICGIDYKRENNRLLFKKESIVRLKSELRKLGEQYEERITQGS
jgi:hypothetical protein